jgi:hypothetical protein
VCGSGVRAAEPGSSRWRTPPAHWLAVSCDVVTRAEPLGPGHHASDRQERGTSVAADSLPGSAGWPVNTVRCQASFSRVTVKVSRSDVPALSLGEEAGRADVRTHVVLGSARP